MGRPGLPPGIYFRLLLIGYFEGHRLRARHRVARGGLVGVARLSWASVLDRRAARSLDDFADASPDRSRNASRRLHLGAAVPEHGRLGQGQDDRHRRHDARSQRGVAQHRPARHAARAIEEFLTQLAKASGIGTPTRADLARIDRKRKKKGSNDDWTHPHDPDAKITKMKDGRTHLAHKAEHAVDLETGAIVGVTVQGADPGDTTTIQADAARSRRATRSRRRRRPMDAVAVIEEVVADKGYHSRTTVLDLETLEIRTYISEPDRGPQSWIDQEAGTRRRLCESASHPRRPRETAPPQTRRIARTTVCASLRDRWAPARARARPRRTCSSGCSCMPSAFNLGLWMRTLVGVGTPRGLQGRLAVVGALISALRTFSDDALTGTWSQCRDHMWSDRPSFEFAVVGSVA